MTASPNPADSRRSRLSIKVEPPEVLQLLPRPTAEQAAKGPAADETPRDGHAVEVKKIYREGEPQSKVAVLVCHGMGQQVPFETLNSVATAIAGASGTKDVTVRHVRIGEKCFPRAEVTVADPQERPRAVHVYESHWAPLMEGRVSARDVTRFLFSTGFAGMRHAMSGSFDRWMFGKKRHLPISPWAPFSLLLAFAFIVCGIALYATLGFVAVAKAAEFLFLPWYISWNGAPLIDALTFELFRSPLALSLVFTPIMLFLRQRPTPSAVPVRTRTRVARWVIYGMGFAAVLAVLQWAGLFAAMGGTPSAIWATFTGWIGAHAAQLGIALAVLAGVGVGGWLLERSGWLGVALTVLFAGLIAWTIGSVVMIGMRLRDWVAGDIGQRWASTLTGWKGTLMDGADAPFYLIFLACALVLCTSIRWFYIQYFGDVAAYLSSHTVNKFHEVRGQIKAIGLETARAVYGARARGQADVPEYDKVLVVGHSLGSVVAYDTLNAILNEDATGAGLGVLDRTQALITFGSPLDKSAFIFRTQVQNAEGREALAAAVQPLIHPGNGLGRTTPWVNLYSPYDPISGSLSFYDPPEKDDELKDHEPVDNIYDREANIPAVAHKQYWDNDALADQLLKHVRAEIPPRREAPVPAPQPTRAEANATT
jgi:hypothetical protein